MTAMRSVEMVMHDSAALPTLGALKYLGVTLAVDDFGSGYSSLSCLKRFSIYYFKIDRSFIIGLTEDSNDVAIVSAIIVMADSLGLKVIAEGVGKAEPLVFLVGRGCD
ncbi:EAL domain-containing protein [Candidatus Methylospira mobilis]|uniref:EAL domain-containing protein n=1 Tax=Candidatus Methylospira mobilis TaxID=1808979 RepID=A0A5Q0BIZ8_9GAMM|nr:EAL domain-containing protein [Candidatus Methylospira mobilis]QFY43790.1 EAL domain-containing protein [Candidatus Methylospira mobilis]WNV04779.1 EAL domain-containing protein [Candidatus Methylospira mobilis]